VAKKPFQVAIVTDDPGWHGRQIADHLDARNCHSSFVRLQDCHISAGAEAHIHIPGFEQLPDGIFVRGVPGGNLEQVVYYLDVLHACEAMSIPVVNNTRCVERSVDKGMTSFLLARAGIATPETVFSSDFHYVRAQLRAGFAEGKEYVLKPYSALRVKACNGYDMRLIWRHTTQHKVFYTRRNLLITDRGMVSIIVSSWLPIEWLQRCNAAVKVGYVMLHMVLKSVQCSWMTIHKRWQ